MDCDGYANPDALTSAWLEALESAPEWLRPPPSGRGRERGFNENFPNWPIEFLELGDERAMMSIKAIVELCLGTEAYKPRTLKWVDFFGPQRVHLRLWDDAYAWKMSVGEATEPRLGRQWREKRGRKSEAKQSGNDWGW